jgi:hypothetical protein
MIFALVALVLLAPVLLRFVRALFRLHLWAVVLFLPAGLLLRFGGNEDMRVFATVTAGWGFILAAWYISLGWERRKARRTGPRTAARRTPYRERLT